MHQKNFDSSKWNVVLGGTVLSLFFQDKRHGHVRVEVLDLGYRGPISEMSQVYEGTDRSIRIRGGKYNNSVRVAGLRDKHLRAIGIPSGSRILNDRALSIVSDEDAAAISSGMGLEGSQVIAPGDQLEDLYITGVPDLSHLPVGSIMTFERGNLSSPVFGASIRVTLWNVPCIGPGRIIEERLSIEGIASRYPKAAMDRRGLLALVYKPGLVKVGDRIRIAVPPQRIWTPE